MPKIIIREIDKTKAGTPNYANFAVVVPGFAGLTIYDVNTLTDVSYPCLKKGTDGCIYYYATAQSTPEKVFDENGVAECSTQDYFVKYIGIAKPAATAAVYADPTKWKLGSGEAWTKLGSALTDDEKVYYFGNKILYSVEQETSTHDDTKGKCYRKDVVITAGTITTTYYKYTKVATLSSITDDGNYGIIEAGKEGADASTGTTLTKGNQIAYELLGLGYTVLYKNLTSISNLGTADFWKALKDKSVYDFRYIMHGLDKSETDCEINNANKEICKIATFSNSLNLEDDLLSTGRGDCSALCEIDSLKYLANNATTLTDKLNAIITEVASITDADKYSGIFANRVRYALTYPKDSTGAEYYSNRIFPASFHYLACAALSSEKFAEWYANSGYTRGVSRYTVVGTDCNFGDVAINKLQPRTKTTGGITKAVNIVIKANNQYYLWGNRTGNLIGTELVASDFLNIRQLCTTIKKKAYQVCRQYTFEPNSDILWNKFRNALTPMLEKMKADQGIKNYEIVKVADDRKAVLHANIRIVPIEAVEDFEINLYLEDSITDKVLIDEN